MVRVCLDLGLYARADSCREARRQIEAIVRRYVGEAFGPDRAHLHDLIPHRAPLRFWLRYWVVKAFHARRRTPGNGDGIVPFDERFPLTLAGA